VLDFVPMSKRGFTLIELLVMFAIIGLVATFAAVAVNSARMKQRDATRLAQVRQLQSALEDFFNENNMYPPADRLPLGDAAVSSCLSMGGFKGDCSGDSTIFLRVLSGTIPSGLENKVVCGTPARNAFCYSSSEDGKAYALEFELENGVKPAGLVEGVNCALPDGMEAGACK